MSAHRVLAVVRRLMAQFRRDRRTLGLLFVAPLLILGLLALLLRGGGSRPVVGVVDLDGGPMAAAVATGLEGSAAIDVRSMSASDAAAGLRDGRVAAYVVLPAGLTAQAATGGPVRPQVHLDGSQPGQSGAVLQALSAAALAAASAQPGPAGTPPPRLAPEVTYLYGGPGLDTLDSLGGAFIGLVVFFLVFVITCVAFLRERSQGTLERLMASPLRRTEIVLGYMVAFTVLALIQSVEVLAFSLGVLRIHNSGSVALIFGIEILLAVMAVNLGILLSMFARTEFQAVQFIPIVVVPQLLLSGVIFPISSEPGWLQVVSGVLPLTYAVSALRDVMLKGADLGWASVRIDVAVMAAFCVLAVAGASATLRRRSVD
jgi:ABC-2 type transport system permease protein